MHSCCEGQGSPAEVGGSRVSRGMGFLVVGKDKDL